MIVSIIPQPMSSFATITFGISVIKVLGGGLVVVGFVPLVDVTGCLVVLVVLIVSVVIVICSVVVSEEFEV